MTCTGVLRPTVFCLGPAWDAVDEKRVEGLLFFNGSRYEILYPGGKLTVAFWEQAVKNQVEKCGNTPAERVLYHNGDGRK